MSTASGNLWVRGNTDIGGNINCSLLNGTGDENPTKLTNNLYLCKDSHYINCGNGGGVIQYYSPYEHKFYLETSNTDKKPKETLIINQNGNVFYNDTEFKDSTVYFNAISFNSINLKSNKITLNHGFYNNYVSTAFSKPWIEVEINTSFDIAHNLNVDILTYPPRLTVLFSTSISPVLGAEGDIIMDITGQCMNINGEVGYSIRHKNGDVINITFGTKRICVIRNNLQYSSGFIKIFLYK
jgi:hypothetical protein